MSRVEPTANTEIRTLHQVVRLKGVKTMENYKLNSSTKKRSRGLMAGGRLREPFQL